MRLFGDFEAVKNPEENTIFVTHDGFLYYIYNPIYSHWHKYRNAGNDRISIMNYPDVNKEELSQTFGGMFPTKETDFMRACYPSELWIRDILDLLKEDYPKYMEDFEIYDTIHEFLLESDLCDVSFEKIKELFEKIKTLDMNEKAIVSEIKKLSFSVIGRDIFKDEIRIVDGHNSSSYFWIMPVRIVEPAHDGYEASVAEMRACEISIEEYNVGCYLSPFLYKYFDSELDANKSRPDADGFEWYLTYNFYTYDAMKLILSEIKDTVDALSEGMDNEFTVGLKNDSRGIDQIVDFYRRFIFRMEYMIRVGQENGYNLISFMGP